MTINRIVVGFDGSDGSRAAFSWATALAGACGAELVAVEAFPPGKGLAPAGESGPTVAEHGRELDTLAAPARRAGVSVRTMVQPGDAREVLQSTAEAEDADLLVVGAYGAGSRPGFLHLGSVVEYLVHSIERPLAVVPEGSNAIFRTLVLGVDGSESNRFAVDWAAHLAVELGLDVTAVAVDEPLLDVTPHAAPSQWRRHVEARITSKWAAPVSDAGRQLEPVAIRNSKPAQGLLRTASKGKADLIVVGTRGLGGFERLRTGGVASQLLRRAPVPVILVPPRRTGAAQHADADLPAAPAAETAADTAADTKESAA